MTDSNDHKSHDSKREIEQAKPEASDASLGSGRNEQNEIPTAERVSGVNKDAWETSGSFHVTTDSQNNTTRIEGWLSLRENEPRSSKDSANQREAVGAGGGPESRDGGHLLAHSLGGPNEDSHGKELAQANLIPMDARINRSYVAGVESYLRRELKAGKEIFAQVDVNYKESPDGEKTPESITHRFYERGNDGQPKPHAITEVTTIVDHRPGMTAGEAVRSATGEKAKDFYSPTDRGALEPR